MNPSKLLPVLAALALSACATDRPYDHDPDFGATVRQLVDAQIYDPAAAANPAGTAPAGPDGVRATEIMKAHHAPPEKTSKSAQPVPLLIMQ